MSLDWNLSAHLSNSLSICALRKEFPSDQSTPKSKKKFLIYSLIYPFCNNMRWFLALPSPGSLGFVAVCELASSLLVSL